MAAYLHDGISLYLDRLYDWDEYFRLRKGDGVDVAAEREALREVLATCAEICASLEPESRAGWYEAAKLENGEVVQPAHVRNGYEKLRAAGLVSFGVAERFGGFELPATIANVILQMVSRADAALMTVMGLQAGVAEDIQRYASEELCQRYLPRFVSGEVQGRDGPDRAGRGIRSRRDPDPRGRGERALLPRRPEDLHHQRRRRGASRARARRGDVRAVQGHHEGAVALPVSAHAARRKAERRLDRTARAQARHSRLADGGGALRARGGLAHRRAAPRASRPCST